MRAVKEQITSGSVGALIFRPAIVAARGLSFEQVERFAFASAVIATDDRKAYPETRCVALGLLGEHVHVLCFTPIPGGIQLSAFAKPTAGRLQPMNKRALLTDADGGVRQVTPDDAGQFKPAGEVLPDALREVLGMRRRGSRAKPAKVPTTIRFDVDLLEALKASGEGWQTRVNLMQRREVLREVLGEG